jgi:5-methylcytosine-specific restriction endonuclease McrA
MILEIKKCITCNKVLQKRKNESKLFYSKKKYCSNNCQIIEQAKTKTKKINCNFCNKEMVRAINKIRKTNFCNIKCNSEYSKKRIEVKCDCCLKSFEKKENQLHTKKNFCSRKCMGNWQSKNLTGESSYNYKNGISKLTHRIRNCKNYYKWRNEIFERDNYKCQECGDKKGGNLNAHHIKFFSQIIIENNINDLKKAKETKELWNVNNGITYCENCHINLHKKIGYDYDTIR